MIGFLPLFRCCYAVHWQSWSCCKCCKYVSSILEFFLKDSDGKLIKDVCQKVDRVAELFGTILSWRSENWKQCHWAWNDKSTIRFQSFPYTTQIWIAMKKLCLPTTLQLHFRALQTLYLGALLDHGSWQLLQKCNSCAATFAVETWAQTANVWHGGGTCFHKMSCWKIMFAWMCGWFCWMDQLAATQGGHIAFHGINIRPNSRRMPWLSTYRPGFEQWWTLEAGRKLFFPTTTAEIKLQKSTLPTLWAMCAQHGLRMDNTGVLAMLSYRSWLIVRKASVWVNLFCAQANLREWCESSRKTMGFGGC